jgi:predicted phosphatase
MKGKLLLSFIALVLLSSCKAIKPYERVYVDDTEMQMGNTSAKIFEAYIKSIREGATPTSGAKSSGGCGCN